MPDVHEAPTHYPEVNSMVKELLQSVQAVLKSGFVGMYLDGSLANGGFDQDSDIDFVVVSKEEISDDLFTDLQAMHDRLAMLDSPFAIQLEGSYLSKKALRRYDPALCYHPNIERGPGERLKWVRHDEPWNIHRSVLRERGIRQVVVAGNGLAALAAMSRMAIPAQLVVCDLLMPECDGFEFMEKLGAARYAGGLLLVSGMDDRTLNSASLMARFHRLNLLGALRKPVEATALVAALAMLA